MSETTEVVVTDRPPVRECGSCSLCCKLLPIDAPGIEKPAAKWCSHWSKATKCGIYEQRPETCRTFNCLWRLGVIPEQFKPDKVGAVMASYKEGVLIVYTDEHLEKRWLGSDFELYLMMLEEKFLVQKGEKKTWIIPSSTK